MDSEIAARLHAAAGLDEHAPALPYEDVDHPQHYNDHPSGVECITIVEWFDFLLGNVIKCIWRAGHQPGTDVLKDLKKAQWYLTRKIEQLEKGRGGGDGG